MGTSLKKLLGILVICLLIGGNVFAENLGTGKTVNDYVNEDYIIVSVESVGDGVLAYTLESNGITKPLVVTCIYSLPEKLTVCVKP